MNVKKTAHHAHQSRRQPKPALASKVQPKAHPSYYARETLWGARLIREGGASSLANAPVLE